MSMPKGTVTGAHGRFACVLRRSAVAGVFPARDPDRLTQAARIAIDCMPMPVQSRPFSRAWMSGRLSAAGA